jgi:hypothetical protein
MKITCPRCQGTGTIDSAQVEIEQAITHIKRALDLQEKTKEAFKSRLIAESRDHTEQAMKILEKLI